MSQDFLVTRVTSIAGKVDEHPVYLDTPEGLIYSGNEAVDDTNPNARTIVRFDIQNTLTDGFRLPSKIRMQVNDNLDVRFSLTGCTVKKSTVLHLPATQ